MSDTGWWHWHRDGRKFAHPTGVRCGEGCGCGSTDNHAGDCRMLPATTNHEEATTNHEEATTNHEEAVRLRLAYKDALGNLREPDESDGAGEWRVAVWQQRNVENLLRAAQMHATLAVADELRHTRETSRMHYPPNQGFPGAERMSR